MYNFATNTTIHGVGKLINEEDWSKQDQHGQRLKKLKIVVKIFWVALICAGFAGIFLLGKKRVDSYIESHKEITYSDTKTDARIKDPSFWGIWVTYV